MFGNTIEDCYWCTDPEEEQHQCRRYRRQEMEVVRSHQTQIQERRSDVCIAWCYVDTDR